eukprot:scaffold22.g6153.t1
MVSRPALAPVGTNIQCSPGPAKALQQPQQLRRQPSVSFALPPGAAHCSQPAAEATTPPPIGAGAPASRPASGALGDSPSPFVLFRGRLSFSRDWGRETEQGARQVAAAAGPTKRRLDASPAADFAAAFPTLARPACRQRRCSSGGELALSLLPLSEGVLAAEEEEGAATGAATGRCGRWEPACSSAPLPSGMECDAGAGRSPVPAYSPLIKQECHALPTVASEIHHGLPCIGHQTMAELLVRGLTCFGSGLGEYIVVDCRYSYEHAGGCIPGSVNIATPEAMDALLAAPAPPRALPPCARVAERAGRTDWSRTALIFHCEFSSERGPRMFRHIRDRDRAAHLHDYPALDLPHCFVLEGGYKRFWRQHPQARQTDGRAIAQGELNCIPVCALGPSCPSDHTQAFRQQHNAVKRAWARLTKTYQLHRQQQKPSYRLRQSMGGAAGAPAAVAAARRLAAASPAAAQ